MCGVREDDTTRGLTRCKFGSERGRSHGSNRGPSSTRGIPRLSRRLLRVILTMPIKCIQKKKENPHLSRVGSLLGFSNSTASSGVGSSSVRRPKPDRAVRSRRNRNPGSEREGNTCKGPTCSSSAGKDPPHDTHA